MKIKLNKYVIATKEKPIEFIDENYDTAERIEEAMLNDSEKIANNTLKNIDSPEVFEVLQISITYEL